MVRACPYTGELSVSELNNCAGSKREAPFRRFLSGSEDMTKVLGEEVDREVRLLKVRPTKEERATEPRADLWKWCLSEGPKRYEEVDIVAKGGMTSNG